MSQNCRDDLINELLDEWERVTRIRKRHEHYDLTDDSGSLKAVIKIEEYVKNIENKRGDLRENLYKLFYGTISSGQRLKLIYANKPRELEKFLKEARSSDLEEVWEIIKEMKYSDKFKKDWLERFSRLLKIENMTAKKRYLQNVLGELYGKLKINERPIYNGLSRKFVEEYCPGFNVDDYEGFRVAFNKIKEKYIAKFGDKGLTNGRIPINLEIDMMFNYFEHVGRERSGVANGISEKYYDKMDRLLKEKGQLILYGPPGTGKTWLAIRYAKNRASRNGEYKFITFHQSYSYEEFVEGIWPATENNTVVYKLRDGIFKQIAIKATWSLLSTIKKLEKSKKLRKQLPCGLDDAGSYEKKRDVVQNCLEEKQDELKEVISEFLRKEELWMKVPKFYLVIDEINRGDISRIFGELITLLEMDKRLGGENQTIVVLPYSQKSFAVPPNLYIIGTMNSADRSIALVDLALRRRFAFLEVVPHPECLKDRKIGDLRLDELLETLNARIEKELDRDHRIGHSYFLNVKSEEDLERVWKYEIMPLLMEYFYNQWDKLWRILGSAAEHFLERIDGRERLKDPEKWFDNTNVVSVLKKVIQ